MTNIQKSGGVRSDFSHEEGAGVSISFFDPAYVRSDMILIDPTDHSIYAVLHEASHYVGKLSRDLVKAFVNSKEVLLTASHNDGAEIRLTTPLSVTVR